MMNIDSIKNKIKQNKILQYLIICIISIVVILLLSLIFSKKDNNYAEDSVESSLSIALEKIDGIKEATILIGYTDSEKVIAYTTVTEVIDGVTVSTKTPYLVDGEVVVIKESEKEISSVIIIVDGTCDVETKIKIQNTASAFLDVGVNIIEIIKAK